MREADLFKAYGMDPRQDIPELTKCSTPTCLNRVTAVGGLFCPPCGQKMARRAKKAT